MSATTPPQGPPGTRASVFVSSTFRDMHAERDHLVTVVFPELRERMERLGLELRDVDLRWGVPEKGIDGEKASPWEYCKRTLDNVEPLFICMLGERYGSVPDPHDLRDSAERIGYSGLSITEMEVRHGVLEAHSNRRSYFYFRETRVPVAGMADAEAKAAMDFVDPPELLRKLDSLKQRIRLTDRPVRMYQCRWTGLGFQELDAFGHAVLEDLWSGVLRDERFVSLAVWRQVLGRDPRTDPMFTDESEPVPRESWEKIVGLVRPAPLSALEAERREADSFVAARTRYFRGRSKEITELVEFIQRPSLGADSSRLAVVTAPPGQGKSALLASLHEQLQASPHFVIARFIGATQRSSDAATLLEHVLEELDQSGIFGPTAERGAGRDLDALSYRLARRLGDYDGQRRIVLLLDALNQLSDGHDLSWLPHRLGPGVRIIVSCLDQSAALTGRPETQILAVLLRRQPKIRLIGLDSLPPADIASIVHHYLDEHCRQLNPEHVDKICWTPQAGNPLYLLVMLEELRALGGNDLNRVVPQLIGRMSEDHPDVRSLFKWVLQRMETSFGKPAVAFWCIYLATGRLGMTSRELAGLLERKLGQGGAANALRIERGLRRYLQRRGAQLDFFHTDLSEAVIELYGPIVDSVTAHREIAQWFEEESDPERNRSWSGDRIRSFVELPYHLARSNPEKLTTMLLDFNWLWAKTSRGLVDELVADYGEAVHALSPDSETRRALELVQAGVRLSSVVIRADPSQLASQMFGRLASFQVPRIQELIASTESWRATSWLLPWTSRTTPTLTRPGGPMLASIAAHESGINAVAISEDGSTAISAGDDGLVRVWDLNRFVCRHILSGHNDEVNAVALFPTSQGYVAATGAGRRLPYKRAVQFSAYIEKTDSRPSRDNSVRIWDVQSGVLLNVLEGHAAAVRCFTTYENFLFSGSDDGTIRMVDTRLPLPPVIIGNHGSPVVMLALVGGIISFSEYDFTLWKPEGGNCGMNPFDPFWQNVLAVYPPRFLIAMQSTSFSGDSYGLQIWDIPNSEDGKEKIETITSFDRFITAARFLKDGAEILVSEGDGNLHLIDVSTGAERARYAGHKGSVRCIDVASGSGRMVSGSSSGELIVWNLKAEDPEAESSGHSDDVNAAALSGDGRLAVTGSLDRSILVWDTREARPLRKITSPGPVYSLAISNDGSRVVAGSTTIVRAWHGHEGALLWESPGHGDGVLGVAFGDDGSVVVSASLDGTLRVLDSATGNARLTFKGHLRPVMALAVVPGTSRVFSGDDSGEIVVWDLHDGSVFERIGAFKNATPSVPRIMAVPRGPEWPVVVGGTESAIHSMAVSDDGCILVVSQGNDLVRVWNVSSNEEMGGLHGHSGRVHSVAVSADGRRAFSASHDGTIRLWDIFSETCMAAFTSDRALYCCATSPEVQTIVAGEGGSGKVHFLRLV